QAASCNVAVPAESTARSNLTAAAVRRDLPGRWLRSGEDPPARQLLALEPAGPSLLELRRADVLHRHGGDVGCGEGLPRVPGGCRRRVGARRSRQPYAGPRLPPAAPRAAGLRGGDLQHPAAGPGCRPILT